MTTAIPPKLKGAKKRRLLVISAGGIQSGIQVLFIGVDGEKWEIFSKAFLPYPQKVGSLIEQLNETQDPVKLSDLGWLEYKVTMLFVECARTALAQAPKSIGAPQLAVLNKPNLWKGPTGENLQQSSWNLSIGDEQFVASSLKLPVLTDFIRHNILSGGPGILPTFPGSLAIAGGTTGIGVFANIGLVSRITIIDKSASALLLESDSGPGTVLIDKCAKTADSPDGFDRDGKLSSQGNVSAECVEELAQDPWLLKPAPKQASPEIFTPILQHPCLSGLSLLDRVATITALTAKSIYDFYRREYTSNLAPEALWVSGGGSNNLSLMEFLSAYFDPVPVRSVEELNVPPDMRIPLALGLTVNSFLSGHTVPWETGNHPHMEPLARWVLP